MKQNATSSWGTYSIMKTAHKSTGNTYTQPAQLLLLVILVVKEAASRETAEIDI